MRCRAGKKNTPGEGSRLARFSPARTYAPGNKTREALESRAQKNSREPLENVTDIKRVRASAKGPARGTVNKRTRAAPSSRPGFLMRSIVSRYSPALSREPSVLFARKASVNKRRRQTGDPATGNQGLQSIFDGAMRKQCDVETEEALRTGDALLFLIFMAAIRRRRREERDAAPGLPAIGRRHRSAGTRRRQHGRASSFHLRARISRWRYFYSSTRDAPLRARLYIDPGRLFPRFDLSNTAADIIRGAVRATSTDVCRRPAREPSPVFQGQHASIIQRLAAYRSCRARRRSETWRSSSCGRFEPLSN